MTTKIISGRDIEIALTKLIEESDQIYMAVAWGSENAVLDALLSNQQKFRKLIFGTHFYQTSPDFLMTFRAVNTVKVMPPEGDTFHPKLYFFISGSRYALLTGSANFTRSAFVKNTEFCVLHEGDVGDQSYLDALSFIEDDCWSNGRARQIDDLFLSNYRVKYQRYQQMLEKLAPLPLSSDIGAPAGMTWDQFASRVKQDPFYDERLRLLGLARGLFAGGGSYQAMSVPYRKAIAGTYKPKETTPADIDWGMFGSMVGFGVLRNMVNDDNEVGLSNALDQIPNEGKVTEENYNNFVEHYVAAFEGRDLKGQINSASRFLAMKRPDYFVCISSANKKGLIAALCDGRNQIDFTNYWQRIITPILESPWWTTPRPVDGTGPIWDGRAAFLDSLYYVHREQ